MSTTANLGMTLPAGTDWADIAVLNANFELIDAAMGAARAAEPYSAAKTYAVGDYCTRNGALFKCTVAITAPEVWTVGHWTATSVAAELLAIIAALSNKATIVPLQYDIDFNTLVQDGFYQAQANQSGCPNSPIGTLMAAHFFLEVHRHSDAWVTQTATRVNAAHEIYERNLLGGTWSEWTPLATSTPPTEYDLPLASGIAPDPSAQNVYSKDQFGIVRVEIGTLGSIAAGVTIGTLPSGSWPAKSIYRQCFIVTASGVSATLVVVGADGSIKIAGFADAATNGVHGTFDFIAAS